MNNSPLKPAKENPWYVLATLCGEQTGKTVDFELHKKNRELWNAWAGMILSQGAHGNFANILKVHASELRGWNEKEHDIKAKFAARVGRTVDFPDAQDEINFTNTSFSNTTIFDGFLFQQEVLFVEAFVNRRCSFNDVVFAKPINFWKSKFDSKVEFNGSHFRQHADFHEVEFKSISSFKDAIFATEVSFSAIDFFGKSNFENTSFGGRADFYDTKFFAACNFSEATFSNHVKYAGTKFFASAIFTKSKFNFDCNFSGADFDGFANFSGSTFSKQSDFTTIDFNLGADFSTCVFLDCVAFSETIFANNAEFVGVTFSGDANFRGVEFKQVVNFKSSSFAGFAYFQSATFTRLKTTKAYFVDFSECMFSKATSFFGATFSESMPDFEGAVIDENTTFSADKNSWPRPKSVHAKLGKASSAIIRHVFAKQGLPEEEHFFFRLEMAYASLLDDSKLFSPYWWFGFVSDYGHSIRRPSLALFGTWFLPSLIFHIYFAYNHITYGAEFSWAKSAGLSFSNMFSFFGFHDRYFSNFFVEAPVWIDALSAIQTTTGYIFIFFLALGLRNRFRLK